MLTDIKIVRRWNKNFRTNETRPSTHVRPSGDSNQTDATGSTRIEGGKAKEDMQCRTPNLIHLYQVYCSLLFNPWIMSTFEELTGDANMICQDLQIDCTK